MALQPGVDGSAGTSHFGNLKIVPDPPDLQAWRERMFNVDEPIELTEDESVHELNLQVL